MEGCLTSRTLPRPPRATLGDQYKPTTRASAKYKNNANYPTRSPLPLSPAGTKQLTYQPPRVYTKQVNITVEPTCPKVKS